MAFSTPALVFVRGVGALAPPARAVGARRLAVGFATPATFVTARPAVRRVALRVGGHWPASWVRGMREICGVGMRLKQVKLQGRARLCNGNDSDSNATRGKNIRNANEQNAERRSIQYVQWRTAQHSAAGVPRPWFLDG